jgi:parallel beta-helix repeat protein
VITENEFTGNETAAIIVLGGSNAIVTNNTSENDGAFVIYGNTSQCLFSNNQGKNFGHQGVLPVKGSSFSIYADAAIDVGPGNSDLVISDNDLESGEAPINNGIAFTTVFAATPLGTAPHSTTVNVKDNTIKGFPENGIVAEHESVESAPTGTLASSWISGNQVQGNGADGIFIGINNHGITFFDNQAQGNHVLDCNDASTGSGTLGTANDWFNNAGNSSYPAGPPPLCTPASKHDVS